MASFVLWRAGSNLSWRISQLQDLRALFFIYGKKLFFVKRIGIFGRIERKFAKNKMSSTNSLNGTQRRRGRARNRLQIEEDSTNDGLSNGGSENGTNHNFDGENGFATGNDHSEAVDEDDAVDEVEREIFVDDEEEQPEDEEDGEELFGDNMER